VWSNPRPAEEEVRRYYSREYRVDYKGQSTPSLRHVARSGRGAMNRYRALAPYIKVGDRILDAGAGGGEVVYVLRKLGFDACGVEPDELYARHAREALGVPVTTGFVQDAVFPVMSFDVVTMYHALEHVEDPSAVLSRLRGWIADQGILLIEVPNVEAVCIAPAHRFHFAHFYNFNRGTLEALGRKTGFEPVQTTTSSDGGNLTTVFRAVAHPQPPQVDTGNYARVAAIVKSHTVSRFYRSASPYIRPVHRLRAYVEDRRAARGCDTPQQVLDQILRSEEHP
jgi:2-polyprenyl-3-methyl-5-hydroxy-6-metoxy-1,4-benzoquinol methylase